MRDWWRSVEAGLNQVPINWDMWFLYAWTWFAIVVVLTGGDGGA